MFLCIEPFPPLTDFQLMEANHTHLSFNWTQVSLNCPSLQYIVASNCGNCPSTTNNKVTCTGNYTQLINTDCQCSFTVQTVVCNDSIVGDISTAINVTKSETCTGTVITACRYNKNAWMFRLFTSLILEDSNSTMAEVGMLNNY